MGFTFGYSRNILQAFFHEYLRIGMRDFCLCKTLPLPLTNRNYVLYYFLMQTFAWNYNPLVWFSFMVYILPAPHKYHIFFLILNNLVVMSKIVWNHVFVCFVHDLGSLCHLFQFLFTTNFQNIFSFAFCKQINSFTNNFFFAICFNFDFLKTLKYI